MPSAHRASSRPAPGGSLSIRSSRSRSRGPDTTRKGFQFPSGYNPSPTTSQHYSEPIPAWPELRVAAAAPPTEPRMDPVVRIDSTAVDRLHHRPRSQRTDSSDSSDLSEASEPFDFSQFLEVPEESEMHGLSAASEASEALEASETQDCISLQTIPISEECQKVQKDLEKRCSKFGDRHIRFRKGDSIGMIRLAKVWEELPISWRKLIVMDEHLRATLRAQNPQISNKTIALAKRDLTASERRNRYQFAYDSSGNPYAEWEAECESHCRMAGIGGTSDQSHKRATSHQETHCTLQYERAAPTSRFSRRTRSQGGAEAAASGASGISPLASASTSTANVKQASSLHDPEDDSKKPRDQDLKDEAISPRKSHAETDGYALLDPDEVYVQNRECFEESVELNQAHSDLAKEARWLREEILEGQLGTQKLAGLVREQNDKYFRMCGELERLKAERTDLLILLGRGPEPVANRSEEDANATLRLDGPQAQSSCTEEQLSVTPLQEERPAQSNQEKRSGGRNEVHDTDDSSDESSVVSSDEDVESACADSPSESECEERISKSESASGSKRCGSVSETKRYQTRGDYLPMAVTRKQRRLIYGKDRVASGVDLTGTPPGNHSLIQSEAEEDLHAGIRNDVPCQKQHKRSSYAAISTEEAMPRESKRLRLTSSNTANVASSGINDGATNQSSTAATSLVHKTHDEPSVQQQYHIDADESRTLTEGNGRGKSKLGSNRTTFNNPQPTSCPTHLNPIYRISKLAKNGLATHTRFSSSPPEDAAVATGPCRSKVGQADMLDKHSNHLTTASSQKHQRAAEQQNRGSDSRNKNKKKKNRKSKKKRDAAKQVQNLAQDEIMRGFVKASDGQGLEDLLHRLFKGPRGAKIAVDMIQGLCESRS